MIRNKYYQYLAIVMLAAVLIRLPVWINYTTISFTDSPGYFETAQQFKDLNFTDYEGFRVPGYPVLILLCLQQPVVIWIVQSILGLAVVYMSFRIAFLLTRYESAALISGLLVGTGIHLVFVEAAMLSEIPAAFFVMLVCWSFITAFLHKKHADVYYALCGIGCGFLALVRPQFFFLGVFLGVACILCRMLQCAVSKRVWRAGCWLCIPSLFMMILWCGFNYRILGEFTISTTTGYSLLNHSGKFIEYADDEYAVVRDSYLEYREKNASRVRLHDDNVSFIAAPVREMQAELGLTFGELSRHISKMSLELFLHHPGRYLKSVFKAWINFWRVPLIWYPEYWQNRNYLKWVYSIWRIVKVLWVVINAAFICLTPILLYKFGKSKRDEHLIILIFYGLIWAVSVVQALTNYGENARYAIPVLPLVVISVIAFVSICYRERYAVSHSTNA